MKNRFAIIALLSGVFSFPSYSGIIQSATYTPQSGNHIAIDFDTLLVGGGSLVDWMIYNDQGIYTQLGSGSHLLDPIGSGNQGVVPDLAFDFSWSDGDSIVSGSSVQGLGFEGYGIFQFKSSIPIGFSGVFRLYVSAKTNSEYNISTTYAGDSLTVDVAANTHGYVDVAFTNNSAYAETIDIQTTSNSGVESSFYAAAVSQSIPEPATLGLVFFFSGILILVNRKYTQVNKGV